ncbi:hypothetical protein ACF0H5_003723 [Mactra antiquata]
MLILSYVLIFFIKTAIATSVDPLGGISALINDKLENYDSRLRPVLSEEKSVDVNITFNVDMLRSFDDVHGEISFLATSTFQWYDGRFTWTPSTYKNISHIVLPTNSLWIPEVMMPSSLNTVNHPGQGGRRVRLESNGLCSMTSVDLLMTYCQINVQYYPYDTQWCELTIQPVGYTNTEVVLEISESVTPQDIESTEWRITQITKQSIQGKVHITISLQRMSTYVLMTMSIPVLLLGFINLLVFILPPESGERISFCITTFLSFTVYMGIFTDNMPKGSNPMADILYFIFIMLVYSVSILVSVIISLRIHTNEGKKEIPQKTQEIVRYFQLCSSRFGKKTSVAQDPKKPSRKESQNNMNQRLGLNIQVAQPLDRVDSDDENTDDTNIKVTWTDVGNIFDKCMLFLFAIWFFVPIIYYYIL